jgi:uncharacterized protein YciI
MFVVLLKFAGDRSRAAQLMEGHKRWIERGFADGVFSLVGSLQPSAGGAVLAHGISLSDLLVRLAEDPFVAEKVVSVEILDIAPSRVDDRLAFLC